jgi:hypothetical protein
MDQDGNRSDDEIQVLPPRDQQGMHCELQSRLLNGPNVLPIREFSMKPGSRHTQICATRWSEFFTTNREQLVTKEGFLSMVPLFGAGLPCHPLGSLSALGSSFIPHQPTMQAKEAVRNTPLSPIQTSGRAGEESGNTGPKPSSSVSQGTLHLAQLWSGISDPYLEETYRLRRVYGTDRACEEAIDILQRTPLQDPLPKFIWKDILLDKMVHFDKLHAALVVRYDWNDEPKEFWNGYALVRKDQFLSRKLIRTESEWSRIFDAWAVGVALSYPHRNNELEGYKKILLDMFRTTPEDPSFAIKFDVDVRERYARSPYRIDIKDNLQTALLGQVFAAAHPTKPLSKRITMPEAGSSRKRSICENWNWVGAPRHHANSGEYTGYAASVVGSIVLGTSKDVATISEESVLFQEPIVGPLSKPKVGRAKQIPRGEKKSQRGYLYPTIPTRAGLGRGSFGRISFS